MSILHIAKQALRAQLRRHGYVVRQVNQGGDITGVELLPDVKALLNHNERPTLFDVGANVGQTIQEFLEAFSDSRIVSFEPSPKTFDVLRERFGGRKNVELENLALGDQQGTLDFNVTEDYSVNDSLLAPKWDMKSKKVGVTVETVDTFCARKCIESIDLLKIDTQGYDLKVLHGARSMLTSGRIKLFVAEAMVFQMYDGQPSLADLLNFADSVGYGLVGFYEQTYVDNRLSYLNACFQRVRA
jgi:FkbM family methyltransferase